MEAGEMIEYKAWNRKPAAPNRLPLGSYCR
jgi:hypothetical protein